MCIHTILFSLSLSLPLFIFLSQRVYEQLHMPCNRLKLNHLYSKLLFSLLLLLVPDDYTFSQKYNIYKQMKKNTELKQSTLKRLNKHSCSCVCVDIYSRECVVSAHVNEWVKWTRLETEWNTHARTLTFGIVKCGYTMTYWMS